ncbi:MAG: YdcF family protein [Chloroflexi bacterium AL-W]|nr:YdcF family protein [Chloroflexi bacterium AL-N1]NOK68745.1 YdcF family protein [Chloroflexi bacterium AL-N10]NOK76231.1 YdcF family protein [Chloroflexi bacterium AL-N5]NOK84132.1 YdcF family protein [Chloroflexi bacterium AL-W]NOK91369.1 YdcF family protein [Chloroflexi bacterium AL-N15]
MAFALALYLIAMALIVVDAVASSYTKADYAVILGNKVHLSGAPSARLVARLDKALELFDTGAVESIMVSGGVGIEGHNEAQVMAPYLFDHGVPPDRVLVDSNGYTTYRTAENAVELIGTDTAVIAVTQYYHVSRTRLAFTKVGFTEICVVYPAYGELRDIYSLAREGPALTVYTL